MFKIHKIANKISPTFRFFISFLFLSFYQELSAQKPEDNFVAKAKELINEKKYSEAEKVLKQADAFGSGEANYYLGMIYYSGWGQEKNYAESFLQFLKSSQRGFGLGDYRLGICYLTGNGVEKDKTRSTKAFQKGLEPILQIANNKQDMEAMYILGRMYEKGYGVEINYPESIKWYAKSAELGHSIAQTHLGVYYEQGLGVEQNQNEAVRWYSQAAEKGYATAQYNLGLCYELGKGVKQDKEKAAAWFVAAAEQGYAQAQNDLAMLYEYGEGVPQDYKKALELYTKASELGNADAIKRLGDMYLDGKGVNRDPQKALELYLKSAQKNNTPALLQLGNIYTYGKGVERNYKEAELWYKKAVEQNNIEAKIELAWLYTAINRFKEAEILYNEVLSMEYLDENIKSNTLHHLGILYQTLKRYDEAENSYVLATQIDKANYEVRQVSFANTLHSLGTLYMSMNRYEDALERLQTALEIRKQKLGENHPDYIVTLQALAETYKALGKDEKASDMSSQFLNLAGVSNRDYFLQLKDYSLVQIKYEELLNTVKNKYGVEHPAYANLYWELAEICLAFPDDKIKINKFREAEELYKEAIIITEKSLNSIYLQNYPKMLKSLYDLYKRQNKTEQSESILLKLYQHAADNFSRDNLLLWDIKFEMALYYSHQQNEAVALKYWTQFWDQAQHSIIPYVLTNKDNLTFLKKREAFFTEFQNIMYQYFLDKPLFSALWYQASLVNTQMEQSMELNRLLSDSNDPKWDEYVFLHNQWYEENGYTFKEIRNRNTNLDSLFEKSNLAENEIFERLGSLLPPSLEAPLIQKSKINWKNIQNQLSKDQSSIELVSFKKWDYTQKRQLDSTFYVALVLNPLKKEKDSLKSYPNAISISQSPISYLSQIKPKEIFFTPHGIFFNPATQDILFSELTAPVIHPVYSNLALLSIKRDSSINNINNDLLAFNEADSLKIKSAPSEIVINNLIAQAIVQVGYVNFDSKSRLTELKIFKDNLDEDSLPDLDTLTIIDFLKKNKLQTKYLLLLTDSIQMSNHDLEIEHLIDQLTLTQIQKVFFIALPGKDVKMQNQWILKALDMKVQNEKSNPKDSPVTSPVILRLVNLN